MDETTIIIDDLFDKLKCTEEQSRTFIAHVLDMVQLFDKKQHDYGPGNIADFGEFGVLVRVNDKFNRLRNLITKKRDAANESIDDTWMDISVYAVIALLLRHNEWKV
jgi:hypothetical protein